MFVVISLENASDSFHTVRFPCLWKLFVLFQTLFLSSRVKKIEYRARIRVVYLDYLTPLPVHDVHPAQGVPPVRTLNHVDHQAEKEPDAECDTADEDKCF